MNRKPEPGEKILHPAVVISVFLLVVNDHVLKANYPSWWTGKLSDFAGLAFFPILLQAIWEIGASGFGRFKKMPRGSCWVAVVATAVVFAAVKTWPPAAWAYQVVWGGLEWMLTSTISIFSGKQLPQITEARLTLDPSDLIALSALVIPLLITRNRALWANNGDSPPGRIPAPRKIEDLLSRR